MITGFRFMRNSSIAIMFCVSGVSRLWSVTMSHLLRGRIERTEFRAALVRDKHREHAECLADLHAASVSARIRNGTSSAGIAIVISTMEGGMVSLIAPDADSRDIISPSSAPRGQP